MVHTGTANLPLHDGKAPRWLFKRMVGLARGIINVIIQEYGREELLRRLSDPFWFQAFSCALGFDWHSSGTTTVTCGALAEAIKPMDHGLAITGGKGRASRRTPDQIEEIGKLFNLSSSKIESLKYASRLSAKIDNAAIQDGYKLYHHSFIFSEDGDWCVIQQGLNEENLYARRYHWLSSNFESFTCEPHSSIVGEREQRPVLDMTSKNSIETQRTCVELVNGNPKHLYRDWLSLIRLKGQQTLEVFSTKISGRVISLDMPRSINWSKIREVYEFQPRNYEEFLSIKGVGPSTVRALALISDLIYGDPPSWEDPVKYSFTVGGKDGVPYPVDRRAMDEAIDILEQSIQEAKIGEVDKIKALRRLRYIIPPTIK